MKTAMTELRDKLLENVKNLSDTSHINEYLIGYRDALKNIANDIDAQMLEKERKQTNRFINTQPIGTNIIKQFRR